MTPDAQAARNARSLVRWRLALLGAAFVLPAGCYGVFERQARRLDALGDHGLSTTATVTAVSGEGIDYAYVVGGARYTWSVSRGEAPATVGERLPVVYLPEDPALSRPGADRATGTREAGANRSFAWKAEAGAFGFFALNAILCELRLRMLRKTGRTASTDPRVYRTTLVLTAATLVPLVALIFAWHLSDSLRRGESVWPAVAGMVGSLVLLGGVGFYVLREGRTGASTRAARVLRWALPLATGLAALRVLASLVGWD